MGLPLSIFNFKKTGSLLAIVLFVLGVCFLEVTLKRTLPETTMVQQFQRTRHRVIQTPAPDWQILGDSVAKGGILTTIMKEGARGNCSIRNDSLPGSSPIFTYFLLRDEIKKGRIPKRIILAHSPHTLLGERIPILVGRFLSFGESVEILQSGCNPFEVLYGLLSRCFYSLAYRAEFKKAARGDFSFFTRPPKLETETGRLRHYNPAVFSAKPLAAEVPEMYSPPFRMSRLNRIYVRKLLDIAGENGIDVVWVTMPVTRRVFEIREQNKFNQDFYAFLNKQEKAGRLQLLQKNFIVYPDALFKDYSHLNIKGGIQFSKYLLNRMTEEYGTL